MAKAQRRGRWLTTDMKKGNPRARGRAVYNVAPLRNAVVPRPGSWKAAFPEEDVVPPRRSPSYKTLLELYNGRQQANLLYYRDRMPERVYDRLKEWYYSHLNSISKEMKNG